MNEKPRHFEDIRQRAISIAKKLGVDDEEKLTIIGDRAAHAKIERVGLESEARYERYVSSHPDIKFKRGTPLEDVYDAIDYWESFPNERLIDLPVQIKSSYNGVRIFRHDKRYKERKGIMLVLNTGPSVSLEEFDQQHSDEIQRVMQALEENNVHFI